ncbi:hypothetical protein GCM10009863_40470 [Streptomyces axinellae]|uniref:Uncharacterized protein n=1 Tax=Streptomyces axinellae TaxID=552788 RepID=A0ABP6CRQ9_9ACTN
MCGFRRGWPRSSPRPFGGAPLLGSEVAAVVGTVTVVGVNTKTRTRIVTGALAVLFVVVILASALGGH